MNGTAGADVSPWLGLVTSAVSLALVLGLAWLLLRWLKRAQVVRGTGAFPQVLRAVALGPRERLVVVRHHDTEFLLGVTAASVSVIERRRIDDAAPDPANAAPGSRPA
jgi:flagellar protein FliO/FliZ